MTKTVTMIKNEALQIWRVYNDKEMVATAPNYTKAMEIAERVRQENKYEREVIVYG